MNAFFLEARALAKRYVFEHGTDLLDHLYSRVSRDRLACLLFDVNEVVSLVVQRRQSGQLTKVLADGGLMHLRTDTQPGAPMRKLVPREARIRAAIPLLEACGLGAREALVLRVALDLAARHRKTGADLVLLTADPPLLGAARREGLTTFNPDRQTQTELDALIDS